MAIFVAGKLMTAPTINEPICGGSAQIDGSFNRDSAKELSDSLNE
jgi:preprotein translocase subunit SecD